MKTITQKVFETLDDLGVTGMHLTRSSDMKIPVDRKHETFLFAAWYCNWCLKNMLDNTIIKLNAH